uniref:Uncharacterized protein n=1 Tax=Amphimedon queenslandica TaxID=400682 RepID=A0A1X7VMF9_AMPQE
MGDRLSDLPPAYQARIKAGLKISAVWAGFILTSAGIFICSKPYLDRRREEREKAALVSDPSSESEGAGQETKAAQNINIIDKDSDKEKIPS